MNNMRLLIVTLLALTGLPIAAQIPQIINYQGKISVGVTPFTGTGQFRFALVDGSGATTFWSNDGTSSAGSQPTAALALPVVNGLYVAPLGDTSISNMTAIPATVFANSDVRVRVWFDDGSNGSQQLSPDQRITSVGYAMVAATVPDGAITTAKLAAAARPRFDRQMAAVTSSNPPVPTTLADVPGLSLTTKDLGENGTYRVEYNATIVPLGSAAGVHTVLNVDGVDLPETHARAVFRSEAYSFAVSKSAIVTGLGPGKVIKLKAVLVDGSGANLFRPVVSIDGVPASQVAP